MRATLSGAGIDPRRVVCEVTERETISQQALFALVAALRASGFRIAVDDYGADNSDMGRIRDIHPDIVKFDAAWIAQLMESGPGYALLERMVSTFAGQGIRVVFEGIEQGWQVELAEKSGTAMVQGYALARPELAPTSFATTGKTALAEPLSPGEPPGRAFPRAPAESDTKSFGRRTRPQ
jgi:EAL domain-containing protein (putative c-di-GMP-specific phosphodiesterase class I)